MKDSTNIALRAIDRVPICHKVLIEIIKFCHFAVVQLEIVDLRISDYTVAGCRLD